MARSGLSIVDKNPPSEAESLARCSLEQSADRRLSDREWAERRRRLVEFGLSLARWDAEQQRKGNSVSTVITLGLGDSDNQCNPINHPKT